MKKIVVCGGRYYRNRSQVWRFLDFFYIHNGKFMLIEGGATGADEFARTWGRSRGLCVCTVAANWNYYDKAAGGIRNRWMLQLAPHAVVAFPGNTGTNDMIDAARDVSIPVFKIDDLWSPGSWIPKI